MRRTASSFPEDRKTQRSSSARLRRLLAGAGASIAVLVIVLGACSALGMGPWAHLVRGTNGLGSVLAADDNELRVGLEIANIKNELAHGEPPTTQQTQLSQPPAPGRRMADRKDEPHLPQQARRPLAEHDVVRLEPSTQAVTGGSNNFLPDLAFKEIIGTSPVVLFVRLSELDSVYLRNLLAKEYEISPEPLIVDLDRHAHGADLDNYIKLQKLPRSAPSARPHPPYLFVNGAPVLIRGVQDVRQLHGRGLLLDKLRVASNGKVLVEKHNAPSNS